MNPFPNPETIDEQLDNEITHKIKQIFMQKGSLDFYEVMNYIDELMIQEKYKEAMICGHYCANMITHSNLPIEEQRQLIGSLYTEVSSKYESNN